MNSSIAAYSVMSHFVAIRALQRQRKFLIAISFNQCFVNRYKYAMTTAPIQDYIIIHTILR